MSKSFDALKRFKSFCKDIDKPKTFDETQLVDLPKYNIYKRSLPAGINKIIAFNLTKNDVQAILSLLKTKRLPNGTVIYYDVISVNELDTSIYFNEKPTIKEN